MVSLLTLAISANLVTLVKSITRAILATHFLLAVFCFAPYARAQAQDFANCRQLFFNNTPPSYHNSKLTQSIHPLCFQSFAVMYSGVSKSPLWAAEKLTRANILQAETLEREDNFHPEDRLASRLQSTLNDYNNSGYDRGHLAPNADMANYTQQYESFSLANITPQSAHLNQKVWREVEINTRLFAKKFETTYVVTGVAYQSSHLAMLNQRVLVPSHLYKAIYIPSQQQAIAYYAPNDNSGRIQVLSLDELTQLIGVDVMPAVTKKQRRTASQHAGNLFNQPKHINEDLNNQLATEATTKTDSPLDSSDNSVETNKQSWWYRMMTAWWHWLIDLFH